MVARRRAEGLRRGQGLAASGPADHLVRVQRDLHERGRGHGFPVHGAVAGEQHPPVRRHDERSWPTGRFRTSSRSRAS